MGPIAYQKCARDRLIASIFMFVAVGNYVVYYFYPLPLPSFIPRVFPWRRSVSTTVAVAIAIPSLYLMFRGMKDAGEETMRPRKEHGLYDRGIYKIMRHPQAIGEMPVWWAVAFGLHSPFLVLFTFIYVPVWWYCCHWEEEDLVLRYGVAYLKYRNEVDFCSWKLG
eukprot:CAMPEP_0172517136 /NCGR_PEP_ID=MMETSP1066-20121228/282032_1 /TAXON_ID=671091 /ORGANISM="Coscinodiscus wailesii, Strain CCMP2513" /LENGTH=165 /DNA_ID=CAMNT_0013298945 /DNA_START=273 /DNA_END=766 /DNA_ORIENTATION=-